jgi:hypothetical protein
VAEKEQVLGIAHFKKTRSRARLHADSLGLEVAPDERPATPVGRADFPYSYRDRFAADAEVD